MNAKAEHDLISCADQLVTNAAFGRPDHSTLYAPESGLGRVVAREWLRRGLAPFAG
jgi:hypothetical protein